MKCRYCNAEVAANVRFCTTCGGDLFKFDKCVNCSNLIDKGTPVCPYCGTEQPQKRHDEQNGSKMLIWIFGAVILLGIMGGGWYLLGRSYFGNEVMDPVEEIVDSVTVVAESSNTDKHSDESKGFYVEVSHGFYFYVPRILKEGEQQGELSKDNSTLYENKGYSLNISVDESDMESQLWMYDQMRSRYGDKPYKESMKTIGKDYLKADDNSGSLLLIMQHKDGKMCGTMYFTYPEGGKAIVEEAIEKSLQNTRENDL